MATVKETRSGREFTLDVQLFAAPLVKSSWARLGEAPKADDASENPFSALADLKRSLQSKQ